MYEDLEDPKCEYRYIQSGIRLDLDLLTGRISFHTIYAPQGS